MMGSEISAIIDASTLIVLAKLNELESLHDIYGPIGVPPAVFEEVVIEGKKRGFDDALIAEEAIGKGFLVKISLSPEEIQLVKSLRASSPVYGQGECEAIACAKTRKALLLIEERKAKALARLRGVRYTIAQAIPLEGYITGKLPCEYSLKLMERIAIIMGTDMAILNALKAAVETIERERQTTR
jgi:predicted nucleic acid-binding protein